MSCFSTVESTVLFLSGSGGKEGHSAAHLSFLSLSPCTLSTFSSLAPFLFLQGRDVCSSAIPDLHSLAALKGFGAHHCCPSVGHTLVLSKSHLVFRGGICLNDNLNLEFFCCHCTTGLQRCSFFLITGKPWRYL